MTITLPPEALEAAAKEQASRDNVQWDDLNDLAKLIRLDDARAACLAMLRAWLMGSAELSDKGNPHIILPLTENSNEQE